MNEGKHSIVQGEVIPGPWRRDCLWKEKGKSDLAWPVIAEHLSTWSVQTISDGVHADNMSCYVYFEIEYILNSSTHNKGKMTNCVSKVFGPQ